MKKLFTYGFAVALAMIVNAEPSLAYDQVRLTFSRTGTEVSSVNVSVADENGQAISGVTAQLVSMGKGTEAVDASTSTAPLDCAILTGQSLNTNLNLVGANFTGCNVANGYAQYLLKISGLQSSFKLNHIDAKVIGVASNGQIKTSSNPQSATWQMQAWTGNNASRPTSNVWISSSFDLHNTAYLRNNSQTPQDIATTGTEVTAEGDLYVVVRFTKTNAQGCFIALREVNLYDGYRIKTTSTSNLNDVATFSASSNVAFPAGVTAYIASLSSGSSVTLSPLAEGKSLPAQGGAILSAAADNTYIDHFVYAFKSDAETDPRTNLLVGGGDNAKELTTGSYYIFNKQGTEAVFSPLSADGSLAANKAALQYSTTNAQPLSITFGETAGINSVTNAQSDAEGLTYDFSGRQVNAQKLPAGIYVKNGKKVIVK